MEIIDIEYVRKSYQLKLVRCTSVIEKMDSKIIYREIDGDQLQAFLKPARCCKNLLCAETLVHSCSYVITGFCVLREIFGYDEEMNY